MKQKSIFTILSLCCGALLASSCGSGNLDPRASWPHDTLYVEASQFKPGIMTAQKDSATMLRFVLKERENVPFNQAAVKQTTEQATLGPAADKPFFTVRFALPIPAAYAEAECGAFAGLDKGVYHHQHSPGFEVMPNGDALAIYFSSPKGRTENDTLTTFTQARLRHGSEDWDLPEQFMYTEGGNDQSGLLWNENGKIWFFGGGRYMSDYVPFRVVTSEDNGVTWTYNVPQLDTIATEFTAQPITNAFRAPDGAIYFACDGADSESFLWRSQDDGKSWHDMGGRTGSRHSTIIPLDDKGNLLSVGGKNAEVNGWNPMNRSNDWGATWSESEPSPFPQLGSVQRPCVIRLQSGTLVYVSDGYMHKKKIAPPKEWKHGYEAFVAYSKDNGETWTVKVLPVQLPQRHRPPYGSLGYTTVRQAPNGVIHLLTTANYPPIHYEFNEAWLYSDAGEVALETDGGEVKDYTENYADGKVKSTWSARICPNGRYLLHGKTTDYYPDGTVQHEVTYENGRKSGEETYYAPDGTKIWTWQRDLTTNRGTWTQFWPNGNKKVESVWNLKPQARDLKRQFFGYVCDGDANHWDENGNLTATYVFKNGILQADLTKTTNPEEADWNKDM